VIAAAALALASIVTPAPSHLAPCPGAYIVVQGDDATGCDLTPPQRLDVHDISRTECDDIGGTYDAPGQCIDADY
jgi:hypothetical protein